MSVELEKGLMALLVGISCPLSVAKTSYTATRHYLHVFLTLLR